MKRRKSKIVLWIMLGSAFFFLFYFMISNEKEAYIAPGYEKEDLLPFLETESPLQDDAYDLIYHQTGLGRSAVDVLLGEAEGREQILEEQRLFFSRPDYRCVCDNWIVRREQAVQDRGRGGKARRWNHLLTLEDGDILITKNSHILGWRNGHAALVIDGEKGKTLEAITLGENTAVRTISKWEKYPNVAVLRFSGLSKEQRKQIASWAEENMKDIPYRITSGFWGQKKRTLERKQGEAAAEKVTGTQCAHLVWQAYAQFGYDLDTNGGWIVTPKQLINNPQLEVVQVYGMDPDALWE